MRIIKEGKVPHKETVLVCKTCNTVFAFLKSDILTTKLWSDSKKIYYINCPLCHQEIITDEESYKNFML